MTAKPISLRERLIKLQLALTTVILVLSSLLFTANNIVVFKRSVERTLGSLTGILGRNLSPALAFADRNEADKVLSSLQTEPGISNAFLIDQDGAIFARYGAADAAVPAIPAMSEHQNDLSRISGLNLIYFRKLGQETGVTGTLVLVSDLRIFAVEYKGYIWIVLLVLGIGFVVATLASQYMQRTLSEPISELARAAGSVSASNDYSIRVSPKDSEKAVLEVVSLAKDFNSMLDQIQKRDSELERKVEERTAQLKEAQKSAVNNAHAAGMAEIATGILHNIGNIVNSINTSVEEIHRTTQDSKVSGLVRANQLLAANLPNIGPFLANDPKGKLLPQYYIELGDTLRSENGSIHEESISLIKKVALVRDVIMTQQEYAKRGLHLEDLPIVQIVEEVLELQRGMLTRHEVKVVKDYKTMPTVRIQRVKFAHILMNLIKNAKEAMDQTDTDKRILRIETGQTDTGAFFLKLSDTGEGIAPENIDRMFNHGFTTKKTGHGFGLHFCANAMTEMGGRMFTESQGKGKGASFTLIFGKLDQKKQPAETTDRERKYA